MVVYHLYHAGPTIVLYTIPPLCNGTRNCSMYWSHHRGKNPVEEIAQAVPYWCPTPLSHVRFVGQRLWPTHQFAQKLHIHVMCPSFLEGILKGRYFPKTLPPTYLKDSLLVKEITVCTSAVEIVFTAYRTYITKMLPWMATKYESLC